MTFKNTFIPYGNYWSSPFSKWQGSFASQHAMKLAASTAKSFFEAREVSPEVFDGLIMGITVHQKRSFYGAPWLAGLIGAPGIGGTTVSQACATSVRALASATLEIEAGQRECMLAVTMDRCSNGPNVYYPDPKGPGGMGVNENPVMDNFNLDPWGGSAMIDTAEAVAKEHGISREEQDAMALLRASQYEDALADDRAFQKRYMVPVTISRGKRAKTIDADEGVFPTTAEGLAGLRPMKEGGTVTFGSQTHPADGNAGMVFTTKERAADLSKDANIPVQVLSYSEARVGKGLMPTAPVPAAKIALERAGIGIGDCKAIKSHNPFAINDVFFCKEMGVDPETMNRYGSPVVWGHPQGPTGLRAICEMIEELAIAGGGYGVFTGCAAGDAAMATVIKVG